MEYISDIITEEEFMSWESGQRVFITAATGTGKSYFVLHKLLIDRVIKRKEKILYLVNRRILKEQLEKEIRTEVFKESYKEYGDLDDIEGHICIMTYQSIEKNIQCNFFGLKRQLSDFEIIVYDECHYFYMDSNFNTNTELSYDCLRRLFDEKIQIFISATMEKVRSCIKKYDEKYFLKELNSLKLKSKKNGSISMIFPMDKRTKREFKDKEFQIQKDYSYINISSFDTYEDLIDIISDNMEEKWLVFADSIAKGKDIQKKLSSKIQEKSGKEKDDIILIDARFKKDEESNDVVEEIIENKKFINKRVLIVTSVMDNGISIIDNELRNIVILYDTEEEFIQMLGRKRENEETVNLYICKRTRNYFRLRSQETKKKLDFHSTYGKIVQEMYKRTIPNEHCGFDCQMDCNDSCRYVCMYGLNCHNECFIYCPYSCRNICGKDNCRKDCKCVYDVTPIFDLDMSNNNHNYKKMYQDMNQIMLYKQNQFLSDVIDDTFKNQVLYSLNGFIDINFFSITRLADLYVFYSDMEEKMKDDEYAFVKEQVHWLGISDDKIDNIADMEKGLDVKYENMLQENIEAILDEESNIDKMISWKRTVSDALFHFLSKNEEDKKNLKARCTKTDRPISPKDFNKCMQIAGLPYQMKKQGKSGFKIEKLVEE